MDNKEIAELIDIDGLSTEIEVVTYLNSEDDKRQYVVYTKGENLYANQEAIENIARIVKDGEILKLEEITEDTEWVDVQHLLKQIANAQHAG